jgi:hypothetical protein
MSERLATCAAVDLGLLADSLNIAASLATLSVLALEKKS